MKSSFILHPSHLITLHPKRRFRVIPYLQVTPSWHHHRCELVGGSASASIETEEVGFFEEDNIPELSLGRVTPAQITRFFQHHRDPNLPTDFD